MMVPQILSHLQFHWLRKYNLNIAQTNNSEGDVATQDQSNTGFPGAGVLRIAHYHRITTIVDPIFPAASASTLDVALEVGRVYPGHSEGTE